MHDSSYYKDQLDKLTRMLCDICRRGVLNNEMYENEELLNWWTEHQEADLRRLRLEEKDRELKAKKNAAINKLTPEERELLGLMKQ